MAVTNSLMEHMDLNITENGVTKRKFERSVLENFTKLTNGQEKIRVKSAINLLKHLESNVDKSEIEVNYALGRLIRGLGASKIHSKSGFYAALVALLNQDSSIKVDDILNAIQKELIKSKGNLKSENSDIASGQILASCAVLRSTLFERSSSEDRKRILDLLLNAGKSRKFLNLAFYSILVDAFSKFDEKGFVENLFPFIRIEVSKKWDDQDLDTIFLLLSVENKYPGILKNKFLRNQLGTSEVICENSLEDLSRILLTIPSINALKHPVYELFAREITKSPHLVKFFHITDRKLAKLNRNRILVVTKLLTKILDNLKDYTIIPDLLTDNYIKENLNIFKLNKDPEFLKITNEFYESLLNAIQNDITKSKTKIKILKKLLFYPGTFVFEKITRTKLIQKITLTLNSEGVIKLAEMYKNVILERTEDNNWTNLDRIYASHLLSKLLNHSSMHDQIDWKIQHLTFLMHLALLIDPNFGNIGQELADSFKTTFFSSLDLKLSKLDDLRTILSNLVDNLDAIIKSSPTLRVPLNQDNEEIWSETCAILKKIRKKKKQNGDRLQIVFEILFLQMSLQLFDNPQLASDSLRELISCYDRLKMKNTGESDDPLWIEVVIDLFLNLLSHNSHLLRNIINCVFPHLCQFMTTQAIHQVLTVLDPKNDVNPLSEYHEDSENDESSDENDSSSSENSEEMETVNEKLRIALHEVLNDNSDQDSINLSDIDDLEANRIDSALSEVFRQFKPNRGKFKNNKKQSKSDETLTHFRIRVLDLIEILINSNPTMLLTLEIMLPLLRLLEFSIRDIHQKQLQDRVRSTIKKLTTNKKFVDTKNVNENLLGDLLKSLLEKGTKNSFIVQDMSDKIAECCIFIVNCSQIVSVTGNCITDTLKNCFRVYFHTRDCMISYVLLKNIVQLNWLGVLEVVPNLFGFVYDENIRRFRRNQALELLRIFYNNNRLLSSYPKDELNLVNFENEFSDQTIDFFRNSNKTVTEKFVSGLFNLLTCIKNRNGNLNWVEIKEVVVKYRSKNSVSSDTKLAYNKLCRCLNIQTSLKLSNNKQNGGVKLKNNKKIKLK